MSSSLANPVSVFISATPLTMRNLARTSRYSGKLASSRKTSIRFIATTVFHRRYCGRWNASASLPPAAPDSGCRVGVSSLVANCRSIPAAVICPRDTPTVGVRPLKSSGNCVVLPASGRFRIAAAPCGRQRSAMRSSMQTELDHMELASVAFPGGHDSRRVRPYVTPENKPHYDALKRGVLLLPECVACGAVRLPTGACCTRCGSTLRKWRPCSGRGTIHSWVRYHRAYLPEFEGLVPYAGVAIRLEEGPLVF